MQQRPLPDREKWTTDQPEKRQEYDWDAAVKTFTGHVGSIQKRRTAWIR